MNQRSLQTAIATYQAAQYDECTSLCDQVLAIAPDDEHFLLLAGLAFHAKGDLAQAAARFRRLTDLRPSVPEHWSNLGLVLREARMFPAAEDAFRQGMARASASSSLLINYGLLLQDMGRMADARHRFLDAHEADPASDEAAIHASLACLECGDTVRAEQLIPPPRTWQALDSDLRNRLALVLMHIGRLEEAEHLLERSLVLDRDPAVAARLAMLYERTNRLDSARTLLDQIRSHLEHGDDELRADILTVDMALAIRAKEFARARANADALLQLGLPPQVLANTHFTAASIADKTRDVDTAMAHLEQAHQIYFRIGADIAPEIAASVEEPLRIAAKWMSDAEGQLRPLSSDPTVEQSPVFIVGFPRSGTTMLEQMLDAHPRYVSMDERTVIQRCVESMETEGYAYPYDLSKLTDATAVRLRACYWAEAAKFVQLTPGQILVDKNPLNMLRLPMIRRLFPSARIIFALRHPCDVVLSCYMQNFRSPAFMVLCSTLERLAKSYVNAMRFWIRHEALLEPTVLHLRYEDTVSDFASQVVRIAAFLGIEDHRYLADFSHHASRKGYISTPSYSQVVEPVNTRALGRWHAYSDYLRPTLPILQPIADHWGYSLETT